MKNLSSFVVLIFIIVSFFFPITIDGGRSNIAVFEILGVDLGIIDILTVLTILVFMVDPFKKIRINEISYNHIILSLVCFLLVIVISIFIGIFHGNGIQAVGNDLRNFFALFLFFPILLFFNTMDFLKIEKLIFTLCLISCVFILLFISLFPALAITGGLVNSGNDHGRLLILNLFPILIFISSYLISHTLFSSVNKATIFIFVVTITVYAALSFLFGYRSIFVVLVAQILSGFLFFNKIKKKRIILFFIAASLLFVIIKTNTEFSRKIYESELFERISSSYSFLTKGRSYVNQSESLITRSVTYGNLFNQFMKSPFYGYGVGSEFYVYNSQDIGVKKSLNIDSGYFYLLLKFGLIGFGTFFLFIYKCFKITINEGFVSRGKNTFYIFIFYAIGLLVLCLVESSMMRMSVNWIILLAWVSCLMRLSKENIKRLKINENTNC